VERPDGCHPLQERISPQGRL